MNTRTILLAALTIILVAATLQGAVATSDLANNTVLYWSHDNSDVSGATLNDRSYMNYDGTISVATTGVAGKINESFTYGAWANTTRTGTIGNVKAWSFWMKPTTEINSTLGCTGVYGTDNAAPYNTIWLGNCVGGFFSNEVIALYVGVGGDTGHFWNQATMGTIGAGAWHHVVISYNATSSQYDLYIDGSYKGSGSNNTPLTIASTADGVRFGSDYIGDDFDNGQLDEFAIFNDTLTQANVNTLYNSGAGIQFPFYTSVNNSYTVHVNDSYDNSDLAGANVTWYNETGTIYSELTSAAGTADYSTATAPAGTFRFNVTKTNYTSLTAQTITVNVTRYVETYQGYFTNATVRAVITNASVSTPFNVSVQGGRVYALDGASTHIYLREGAMNLTFQKDGWYNLTWQENVTYGETNTTEAEGAYSNLYHFNVSDIYNNVYIQNFSIVVYNTTLGGLLYNESTTNGNISFELLQGYEYLFVLDTLGLFEYVNATLAANTSNQSYMFEVLPTPSIDITIRDAATGTLITENMTIVLTSNTSGTTIYTTTGGYFATNLSLEQYTIKIYNANYTEATYVVTATAGTVYYLTAYLQVGGAEVIMEFVDSISITTPIEGAAVSQYAIVNGSWVVISNRITDVTGSTKFEYLADTEYRFVVTATNYTTKSFSLNPVLFDSYTVKMVRSTALDFDGDFQSVYIGYTPKTFTNGAQNQINFTFSNPSGGFTSYNYNVTAPGGSANGSGVNAVGETLTATFNITGATITDRVNITLVYDTSIGDPHTFRYSHAILINPGNTTFIANMNNTYGMGLIERLIIGTFIIILISGLVTIAVGPLWGAMLALLLMGVWIKIGFWPWWAAGLSFLVGFALLAGRTD